VRRYSPASLPPFHAGSIHAKLRPDLEQWLTKRGAWPSAGTSRTLFLNTKGGRLSVRTDSSVIAAIADDGGPDDETTAHVLRRTFATALVRGGTDLVVVAELMDHARLETTRQYSLPTEEDKADALNLLTTDH
jgi:site-specific recombinase XerD